MRFLVLVFVIISGMWSSCAASKKNLRDHKGSYLESAKINFEAGEDALKNNEYDKATSYFQFVRSKYPFSQYAALSDLKLADTKFAQEKWLEAASSYEVFIRLHPRHEKAEFASYQLGLSYFNAIPKDFFLLPKPVARDQSFAKDALTRFERFIMQYPTSTYANDAKEKRRVLFSYLAQHNQLIANYYFVRKKYQAAVDRHLRVATLYRDTKEAADSLYRAAQIELLFLKHETMAANLLNQLINEYPDDPNSDDARKKLHELQGEPQE